MTTAPAWAPADAKPRARKSQISASNRGRFPTRDADPIVTLLQCALEDSGLRLTDIAARAPCSYQTVANIADGKTIRPTNMTRDNILRACGIDQSLTRFGKPWKPSRGDWK